MLKTQVAMDNDTNDFYDAIADYYPLLYKDWKTQLEREGLGLRAIFRKKGILRVLVAACGVGTQAIPLAELGYEVIATDASGGMLRKAKDNAAERGVLDKIDFQQSSFEELPTAVEGPFDAVVCKGNALPHLLTDAELKNTLLCFHDLLRPGGSLVVGMRDFEPFMDHRPRFLPGFDHTDDFGNEFITFEIWDWEDGPPMIATQNLYMVKGKAPHLETLKRTVSFRPLSIAEVKGMLRDIGYEDLDEHPDRWEQVVYGRKPLGK